MTAGRLCTCGSGLERDAAFDARGIFLTYVCAKCERAKLSRYRPDVLSDPNYWAAEPIEPDDDDADPDCTHPEGHEWSSPSEEYDRVYCIWCGRDGDG